MDAFTLIHKRKHIHKFDTVNIPKKYVIEECLWKAWKVTPSKQNFMPYSIAVLGPDKRYEKEILWNLSRKHQKSINEENAGKILGIKGHKEEGNNPNFLYLETAPYILIISQRVCKPNPYIQKRIDEENIHYEQMHSDSQNIRDMMKTSAFEAGLFVANLWTFLLEHNIDLNVSACFPPSRHNWGELSNILEHPPIMVCAIGYCQTPRRNNLTKEKFKLDLKPEPEEIIQWI